MKAIVFSEFGGAGVLRYEEIPIPGIAPNQALIRVHGAGVNPADWKMREGYLQQLFPHKLPVVPGWELAGTVVEIGPDVKNLEPGAEIFCYNRLDIVQYGSYAEYAPVNAAMTAHKPANLSFVEAATVPLTALTAWQVIIETAQLKSNETILVTAGAGGVGGFAIQLARSIGARVCTTASAHNHDYVRSLGAELAIDYRRENIADCIHAFAGQGVDVVFDCTGSEDVAVNFDYVRKDSGRVITINGLTDTVPVLKDYGRRLNVQAELVIAEPDGKQLNEIRSMLEAGMLRPLPVETYPLSEAKTAQIKSQQGHVRGKLALQVSQATGDRVGLYACS